MLHASKQRNSKQFWANINFLLNVKHRHFNSDIMEQTWRAHTEATYNTTAPSNAASTADASNKIGMHISSSTKSEDMNQSIKEELDSSHRQPSAESLATYSKNLTKDKPQNRNS